MGTTLISFSQVPRERGRRAFCSDLFITRHLNKKNSSLNFGNLFIYDATILYYASDITVGIAARELLSSFSGTYSRYLLVTMGDMMVN